MAPIALSFELPICEDPITSWNHPFSPPNVIVHNPYAHLKRNHIRSLVPTELHGLNDDQIRIEMEERTNMRIEMSRLMYEGTEEEVLSAVGAYEAEGIPVVLKDLKDELATLLEKERWGDVDVLARKFVQFGIRICERRLRNARSASTNAGSSSTTLRPTVSNALDDDRALETAFLKRGLEVLKKAYNNPNSLEIAPHEVPYFLEDDIARQKQDLLLQEMQRQRQKEEQERMKSVFESDSESSICEVSSDIYDNSLDSSSTSSHRNERSTHIEDIHAKKSSGSSKSWIRKAAWKIVSKLRS